jgi:hypothetical protein
MLDSGLALRSRLSALRFSLADDRWLRVADPPWWADGFAHLLPVLEGNAGEYRGDAQGEGKGDGGRLREIGQNAWPARNCITLLHFIHNIVYLH